MIAYDEEVRQLRIRGFDRWKKETWLAQRKSERLALLTQQIRLSYKRVARCPFGPELDSGCPIEYRVMKTK